MTEIDNKSNRNKILSNCLDILSQNKCFAPNKMKTIDCDAISFVIVADSMDDETKDKITNFLLHFGATMSSVTIPNVAKAANKNDSIFGGTRNKSGSQHLKSCITGTKLMSGESLVITAPVNIAVHKSCRKAIVSYLCKFPYQYPMHISTNQDICFDTNSAANTPPYGVIVEAILDSCFIMDIGKHVVHVANIGKRYTIHCDDKGCCPINSMFEKVKIMRESPGITVEMTQLDIAFNIPTEKNSLIQCSYKKVTPNENKKKSSLESMTPEIWPLHTIRMRNDRVDSRQIGTARLKQKKWDKPKITSFLMNKKHYNDSHCSDNTMSSDSEYSGDDDGENTILAQVYEDSSVTPSTLDHMDIDMKSIYSVKFYSTLAHFVTQRRSQLPLTYLAMVQLPKSSMVSLQRLLSLILKISGGAMNHVKRNGICARLEISVRPSCSNHVGNSLRCHGHLIDILAHVHITIHELFLSKNHMLSFTTISHEPVYRKILLLVDQLQSMTRLRASVRFCDIYTGGKCSTWLRAIVTVIMTSTGLAGESKLKFFKKWVDDENRYTPNDMSPQSITDLHTNLDLYRQPIIERTIIPDKIWALLKKCLQNHHLSDGAISSIIFVLNHEKPIYHSRKVMVNTSLQDKWNLATNIRKHVIPVLSLYFQKDSASSGTVLPQSTPTVWSDRDNFHNILSNSSSPETFFPQELIYPTLALNQFNVNSAILNQPKLLPKSTQDPLLLVITRLSDLSLLFDVYTPVFVHYLFEYINLCHTRSIKLPNLSENLVSLQNSVDNSFEFNYATQCINEKRCDQASLPVICSGLDVEILNSHHASTEEIYLASLCNHYLFPCQLLTTPPNISSISRINQDILNDLLCETFKREMVFEMKSHLFNRKHYYRFQEDAHLWIHVKESLISSSQVTFDNSNIMGSSPDLYIILDKCFNKHATPGLQMRINLHIYLSGKSSESLCNSFLLDDGSNNPDFFPCDTVNELLILRNILFVEDDDTPLGTSNYSNMSPEVILPCTALLYEENIFFIDILKNQSYLHTYDQNSTKVFTYIYQSTCCLPATMLNCKIFLKDSNNVFSIVQSQPQLSLVTFTPSASLPRPSPFLMQLGTRSKSLAKHPQGRATKCRSFVDSMLKLLCSENVQHPHFICNDKQYQTKQDDPLDIIDYVNEFALSFSSLSLDKFFDATIIYLMGLTTVAPISSWTTTILTQYTELPHTMICPVLCLKYKFWIAVWEDQGFKDGKLIRASYFYCFDNIRGIVSCQIINDYYMHLPFQSHIFYFKCTKGANFGYWKQDPLNPYINSSISFNEFNLLVCKYSYLDYHLRLKIYQLFKDEFMMNILSMDDYGKPNFHDSKKPTLVPMEIRNDDGNLLQHALMIIYPFDNENETYFGIIIHTEISTDLLKKNTQDFLTKTRNSQVTFKYVIDELSLHQLSDFNSSFFLIIHMYIAHMSKDMKDLRLNFAKLISESGLVQKTKSWISTLISKSITGNILIVPQWLHQITSHNVKQYRLTNIQSVEVNQKRKTNNYPPICQLLLKRRRNVSIQGIERSTILPTTANDTIEHSTNINSVKSNIINIINSHSEEQVGIFSIFDHASKYENPNFNMYIDQVQSKSEHNCICAVTRQGTYSLSVIDLSSIIEQDWITELTVNFMGMILIDKFQQVSHIYPSHFMGSILRENNDTPGYIFSQVQTWHKDISATVNNLYIPIHTSNIHWMVSKFDFLRKTISLWNPSNNTNCNEKYLMCLKSYAENVSDSFTSLFTETRWTNTSKLKWSGTWKIQDMSNQCPKVEIYEDAGVFTLLNMTLLIQGKKLTRDQYSQREIIQRKTRFRIAGIIYENIDWEEMRQHNFN